MSAPADQRPVSGHHAQAFLYEAGVSGIGEDAASHLAPHEVRQHGVRQIGKRAVQFVVAAGLATALAIAAGNAVDHEVERIDPSSHGSQPGGE